MAWNNGRGNSPYKSSKEFVPFCQPRHYFPDENAERFSGYVDLKLTCCTDIYIGSGFSQMPENGKQLVYQTMTYDGKAVIPGSSFKGVVRNLASAVSNSCLPFLPQKDKDVPARYPDGISNISCKDGRYCIVCDIFGAMSKGSKVMFSDMYSENAIFYIKELNAQYGPKPVYTDKHGIAKGYKFFMTGEHSYEMPSKIKARVVKKGAVFTGRVHFKKITEEELALLMFSLGLNDVEGQDIVLKIGGFKNEGMGEVKVSACDFVCSDMLNKSAGELTYQYYNMPTANQDAIEKIRNKILKPV